MSALFDRQELLNEITFRLSVMEVCLKWHTSRGHNDNAKIAEDVVARFLAALCGWKLVNLNTIKPNYPAADLGDPDARIAVQVTVNGTPQKVHDTHAGAIKHRLAGDFDILIILFLLEEAPADPRKSKAFIRCDKPKIEKWARPQLNERLAALHPDGLRRVLAVLRDEMTGIHYILAPTRDTPPHNLPFASLGPLFKDRGPFLDNLHAALLSTRSALIRGHSIHGDGGIGKTCAATEYAWRQFFLHSGLFFVPADDRTALEAGLAALGGPLILRLDNHGTKQQPDQIADVLDWLRRHPNWLLILDNADTKEALAAALEYLPRLPGGHVILTTRYDLRLRELTALDMELLTPADSIALLDGLTGDHRTRAPDDEAAVQELAGLLDGLPLGISQAAAHICDRRFTSRDYIRHWQAHTDQALAWYDPLTTHYPAASPSPMKPASPSSLTLPKNSSASSHGSPPIHLKLGSSKRRPSSHRTGLMARAVAGGLDMRGHCCEERAEITRPAAAAEGLFFRK